MQEHSECASKHAERPGYLGLITPGSLGFDLDGYVFRTAACGHGTNLPMLTPTGEILGMRPCPVAQLVGPVKSSRGWHLLWIHERWYEQSADTAAADRVHWRRLHEWQQRHTDTRPYYDQLVREHERPGAFAAELARALAMEGGKGGAGARLSSAEVDEL